MTKLTITNFLFLWMNLLLLGCGSLTEDQLLSVEMYGVSKSPEGATGTQDPNFQTYQLLKIDIVSEDGATSSNLFDNEEEKIFRIVDREQLIYSKKIAELEGTSYSSIQLTFAPDVIGGESEDNSVTMTLGNPVLTLSQAFTVEKAKDLTLLIKINWGNTLTDEAMTEPQYVLSLD
ncbi:MAG: hypothetical protein M3Q07_14675 [Pseudobdellovibrionaceae bacterium]|nr:hypothetical protein [Pseudobdellovibrionaceae bacterium]